MNVIFEAYLERMGRIYNNILSAIEGLPQAGLDWVPGPDMNSISMLVFHLTGAERYWIGDVVLGDPSNRDRPAEFRVKRLEAAAKDGSPKERDEQQEPC